MSDDLLAQIDAALAGGPAPQDNDLLAQIDAALAGSSADEPPPDSPLSFNVPPDTQSPDYEPPPAVGNPSDLVHKWKTIIESEKGPSAIESILRHAPWMGSVARITDNLGLIKAAERIKGGRGTDEDFSLVARQMVEQERAGNRTNTDKFLEIIKDMPAFMAEFLATGGLYKAGEAATAKVLGKAVESTAGKAAAAVAGAALQTAGSPGMIAEGITRRAAPQFGAVRDQNGDLQVVMQEGKFEPVKATVDAWIEILSERMGGHLIKLPGFRQLQESLVRHAPELFAKEASTAAGRLAREVFKDAGYDGPIPEFLEERFGDIVRSLTGVQPIEAAIPSLEQVVVELTAFSVPHASAVAIDRLAPDNRQYPMARPIVIPPSTPPQGSPQAASPPAAATPPTSGNNSPTPPAAAPPAATAAPRQDWAGVANDPEWVQRFVREKGLTAAELPAAMTQTEFHRLTGGPKRALNAEQRNRFLELLREHAAPVVQGPTEAVVDIENMTDEEADAAIDAAEVDEIQSPKVEDVPPPEAGTAQPDAPSEGAAAGATPAAADVDRTADAAADSVPPDVRYRPVRLEPEEVKPPAPKFAVGDRVEYMDGGKRVTGTVEGVGTWNASIRRDDDTGRIPILHSVPIGIVSPEATTIVPAPEDKPDERPTERPGGIRPEGHDSAPVLGDGAGQPGGAVPETPGGTPEGGQAPRAPRRGGKANAGAGGQSGGESPAPDGVGAEGDRPSGVDRPGESGPGGSDAKPGGSEDAPRVSQNRGRNHVIEPDDVIVPRGDVGKVDANVRAIEILHTLEAENRPATPREKKELAQYVGWGALSQAFDDWKGQAMLENRPYGRDPNWEKKWGNSYRRIRDVMTEDERRAAKASTLNAHYTSREIIGKMWEMARRLGFKGGTVLEPASGVGHFLGLMPADLAEQSKFVAVELDNISAKITAALYPRAQMFASGLETVDIPPNTIDLAISNVPFHQIGPADAKDRYGVAMNLHNYFLARMIDAVKPGGIVLAISTHHSMDSQVKQREVMADRAELLGAIRLPNNAFAENAGTEVVTDILVLRKPPDGIVRGEPWKRTGEIRTADGKKASVNEYFVENGDMMLGAPSMAGEMRGGEEFTLLPDKSRPLSDQMNEAIAKLPENMMGSAAASNFDFSEIGAASGLKEGTLVERDGQLAVVAEKGKFVPVTDVEPKLATDKGRKLAKAFIKLRDHYQKHLALMASDDATDDQVTDGRKELGRIYDAATKAFGPINGGRTWKMLDFDPGYFLVAGLERAVTTPTKNGKFKKEWLKAAVFEKRTIMPSHPPSRAENIRDALRISLSYKGRVDVPYMASLLGQEEDAVSQQAIAEGLAWPDPRSGLLQTKEEYLSGNVRQKLHEARQAAKADPRYQPNVAALEAVQPPIVAAKNISMRLGGAWVPADIVQEFARQTLGNPGGQVRYVAAADSWAVSGFGPTPENAETWATERFNGHQLLDKALNLQQPLVYDTVPHETDPKKTRQQFNQKETVAAQAKVEQLRDAWTSWVRGWADVLDKLQHAYNEAFNFWVETQYDGSHLDLPGMSQAFKLRPYQKNVVWRLLQRGRGLLAHAVGAGKTLVMISTAMEMRRLGLARKPMVVVLNSTLPQFAAQWRTAYPQANLLIATKRDLEAKNRKRFMARIASGDYDAIVVAQSSFDLLPVNAKRAEAWINSQLDELETIIAEAKAAEGKKSPTVKELEGRKRSLEKQLKKMQDKAEKRQDDVLTFEQLGVDALFVDEAHAYKKPPFVTKLQRLVGLNVQPSQRAFNLLLKLRHIQENNRNRNVFLATGTPVTNTLGEAWHMQNLVDPLSLDEFNVQTFDRFATAFAEIAPTLTQNAGGRWVMKDAIAKFVNGFQLAQFIRSTWDVLTTPDLHHLLGTLGSDIPKIKGGKPENVVVPLSPAVEKFTDYLKRVYAKFESLKGKEKREFSYIPVVTYGAARAAALDIRLVDPSAKDDPGSKINTAVGRVHDIWQQSAASKSTQLIFLDSMNKVNTTKLEEFLSNDRDADLELEELEEEDKADEEEEDLFLYRDMARKLIARGVPAEEIAIINDHDSDAKRAVLFDKVNAGDVRIVMGSSKKLGTGVNVQSKLLAVHHIDAPWLPADLEQRNGRILRQGNENAEVQVINYGMAETLDAAIQVALVRKSKMIEQALSGKAGAEFDDPAGQITMSAQEQMAALSGDPRIFEKIDLENRVRNLSLEAEAHADANARRRHDRKGVADTIERLHKQRIPRLEAVAAFIDQQPAELTATFGGKEFGEKDRKALAAAFDKEIEAKKATWIDDTIKGKLPQWDGSLPATPESRIFSATINGLDVSFHVGAEKWNDWRTKTAVSIRRDGMELYFGSAETGDGIIEAALTRGQYIERTIGEARKTADEQAARLAEMDRLMGEPFAKQEELNKASARLGEIKQSLVDSGKSAAERAAQEADERPEEPPPLGAGLPVLAPRRVVRPNATERKVPGESALRPEVRKRLRAAETLPPKTVIERIKRGALLLWRAATRGHLDLPRNTKFAPANDMLRRIEHIPGWAQHEAGRRVAAIIDPMGEALYPYFNMKLVAANALDAVAHGEPHPFGFENMEEIERWADAIDAEIAAMPDESRAAIEKALSTRRDVVREIVEQLVEAKLLHPSALERSESYFHQNVLLYARMEQWGEHSGGGGGKSPALHKAPFQRRRLQADQFDEGVRGEQFDYITDFVQAEGRWMTHALAILGKHEVVQMADRTYGKLHEFKQQAARRNWVNFVGGPEVAATVEKLKAEWAEAGAVGADAAELAKIAEQIEQLDATWALSRRIGRLSGRIRAKHPNAPGGEEYEGDNGDEHSAWFRFLNDLIEADPDSSSGLAARGIFKAIDEKRRLMMAKLGVKYADWRTILHENQAYTDWQARPGTVMYRALSVPDALAEALESGLIDELKLTKDQLKAVTVLGKPRDPMVLPVELAAAFDNFKSEAPTHALGKIAAAIQSGIKQLYLYTPWRIVGHTARNLGGNIDAGLGGGAGGSFKLWSRAGAEILRANRGYLGENEDMRAARKWAVIGSGFTAQEWADFRKHPATRRFFASTDEDGMLKQLAMLPVAAVSAGREINAFQEDMARYAAYLWYKQKLADRTLKHGGGSFLAWIKEIDRTMGREAAAAHAARQLYWDYGDMTVLGRAIRRYAIPFHSWTESLMVRYPRMFYNSIEYSRLASKGNAWARPVFLGLALSSMAAMYAFTWAWNHLVMPPDDEEALSPSERASPHVNMGRDSDGRVRVFRNFSAFGDFADWFGLSRIVELWPKYANGQIKGHDIAQAVFMRPAEKFLLGLGPHIKGVFEIATGSSSFPDPLNPRAIPRDEAVATALGAREEYLGLRGWLLKDGTRPRKGYWERYLGYSQVDVGQSALSEIHALRDAWLEAKGKPRTRIMGLSKYRAMRSAGINDDYQAFVEGRKVYVAGGGTFDSYRDHLRALDPLEQRLNPIAEREFIETLSPNQRGKLDVARRHAADLEVKLTSWWLKAATPDERAAALRELARERQRAMESLRSGPPEWKAGQTRAEFEKRYAEWKDRRENAKTRLGKRYE